jgi:predicted esterase
MKPHLPLAVLLLAATAGLAAAQYEPPNPIIPDDAKLKEIKARTDKLEGELAKMRAKKINDPVYSDVEIYLKAAQWIVKYKEFYSKDAGDWTLAVLDQGLLRASQAQRGETPWLTQTGYTVARGYHSTVDGSVQPYAITFPAGYGQVKDPKEKKLWRLDVVLHGRNASLTEVSFLHQHDGTKAAPKDLGWVQIDIYGRGNNAYRWAGETDVYEVLDHFLKTEQVLGRAGFIDFNRVVLRGFSMGGAGTWHLGLHQPDRWAVIGPGAGFTTTKGYVGKFPEPLTPTQEATLHIYDAVDYAENVFDVPVVAYAGADDKQLQASRNVEEALKKSGLKTPFTLLVAPGLEHKFPPEWQKKAEDEYQKHLKSGRPEYPAQLHFVTYTLKYPTCYWINILGLDKHYERTVIDGKYTGQKDGTLYELKTANVRLLDVVVKKEAVTSESKTNAPLPVKLSVDGQDLEAQPSTSGGAYHVFLEKRGGRWRDILPERYLTDRLRTPQKSPGLQGPIDDAFMNSFLLVHGTGRRKAWHEATERYAEASLERFQKEWSKFLRAELPVKFDTEVTAADIANYHLILFGDPASNSLIEQVMPGLPFQWTRDKITWDGKEYAAGEHVPLLVYPSPLNTERYVVLNSGHTFHASDFAGTNALLYPRLGDHALLKLDRDKKDPLAVEVVRSGLFDDFWRFAAK